MSPHQIQLMKLIQLPSIELDQRIKEEMEINPALEDTRENDYDDNEPTVDEPDNGENDDYNDDEVDFNKDDEFDINDYLPEEELDDYSYKTQAHNYGPDDDPYEAPVVNEETFQDYLNQQLIYHDLTEEQLEIGEYIIGNLDDNGYLNRAIPNLVDDLLFTMNLSTTEEEVAKVLSIVQQLDPPGIAARNLQECLLIQLRRLQEESPYNDYSLPITIISDFFEEFTKKHYDKIAKKLDVSNRELKAALDTILKLNPKPADASTGNMRNIHYITPDFFVFIRDGKVELSMDARNLPELHVSKQYIKMLEEFSNSKNTRSQQEAIQFVKQKIDAARWFIDNINQRNETLYTTMKAIINLQEEFFLTGDEAKLKPMILKDVSDKTGLDISTISRVANSKYVQTPYGTFLLKFFFSEGITNDEGEEVSNREIKKTIKDAVENEDKTNPMTDEQLMQMLKEKGYSLARRTIAKYRVQLGIPSGRMRKKI